MSSMAVSSGAAADTTVGGLAIGSDGSEHADGSRKDGVPFIVEG
jgi:hypothetical protein